MKDIKDKYDECTKKEKIAIITALVAFGIGWGLTIAGFIVPPTGEVADSVLWILGQSLVYAASVFGITGYFSSESKRLKRDVESLVDTKIERLRAQETEE